MEENGVALELDDGMTKNPLVKNGRKYFDSFTVF